MWNVKTYEAFKKHTYIYRFIRKNIVEVLIYEKLIFGSEMISDDLDCMTD